MVESQHRDDGTGWSAGGRRRRRSKKAEEGSKHPKTNQAGVAAVWNATENRAGRVRTTQNSKGKLSFACLVTCELVLLSEQHHRVLAENCADSAENGIPKATTVGGVVPDGSTDAADSDGEDSKSTKTACKLFGRPLSCFEHQGVRVVRGSASGFGQ